MALDNETEWGNELKKQIPYLYVERRAYNSAGGYTDFVTIPQARPVEIPENASYPPVVFVEHPLMPSGGAYIVWVSSGIIRTLEANNDGDGRWPELYDDLKKVKLSKPQT